MEAHGRRGIVLLMFTFAAPCGPSCSFVTWSLACLARSVVFVLVRVLPKKKDILSGTDVAAGLRGWRSMQAPVPNRVKSLEWDGASLRPEDARASRPWQGSPDTQTNRECQSGFLESSK
jgi:hypothetical protein